MDTSHHSHPGDRPDPAAERSSRDDAAAEPWAPWWVYVVIIVGANLARSALMSDRGLSSGVQVAAALGLAAVLFTAITVVWRIATRGSGR